MINYYRVVLSVTRTLPWLALSLCCCSQAAEPPQLPSASTAAGSERHGRYEVVALPNITDVVGVPVALRWIRLDTITGQMIFCSTRVDGNKIICGDPEPSSR